MPAYTIDSGAAPLSIRLVRGDEFNRQVRVSLRDLNEPLSVEGFEITAPVMLFRTFEQVAAFNVTVIDAANGLFALSMQEADTVKLEAGSYRWRLKWTRPEGVTETILRGVLDVLEDVAA